jgi:hypothetical protein
MPPDATKPGSALHPVAEKTPSWGVIFHDGNRDAHFIQCFRFFQHNIISGNRQLDSRTALTTNQLRSWCFLSKTAGCVEWFPIDYVLQYTPLALPVDVVNYHYIRTSLVLLAFPRPQMS